MEDDLITTKEVGDYRIKVYYCRDSECPITNWGLFGSFDKGSHDREWLRRIGCVC